MRRYGTFGRSQSNVDVAPKAPRSETALGDISDQRVLVARHTVLNPL
jgi:hypothetical protein